MKRAEVRRQIRAAALLGALIGTGLAVSGCKVMTVQEDRALRARRSADLDAPAYVAQIWDSRVLPVLKERTVAAATLLPAVTAGLEQAGAKYGRKSGEGAPWTFVVEGSGTVTAIDDRSRRRTIEVALADSPARTMRLQIGPVVSGTAIRDALPFVTFNDFADQLAFADVGRALTARALTGIGPALGQLRPGQRIRFVGVTGIAQPQDAVLVTPVSITPEAGKAG